MPNPVVCYIIKCSTQEFAVADKARAYDTARELVRNGDKKVTVRKFEHEASLLCDCPICIAEAGWDETVEINENNETIITQREH